MLHNIKVAIDGLDGFNFKLDTIDLNPYIVDTMYRLRDTSENLEILIGCSPDGHYWIYEDFPNNLTLYEKNIYAQNVLRKDINWSEETGLVSNEIEYINIENDSTILNRHHLVRKANSGVGSIRIEKKLTGSEYAFDEIMMEMKKLQVIKVFQVVSMLEAETRER